MITIEVKELPKIDERYRVYMRFSTNGTEAVKVATSSDMGSVLYQMGKLTKEAVRELN